MGGNFRSQDIGTLTRSGGTLLINGTMDNSGSNFVLDAAHGAWIFFGGTISGGTITSAGGSLVNSTLSGGPLTMSGVTLAGDFVSTSNVGAGVLINNGLTLNNAIIGGGQVFVGSQALSGTGTVTMAGGFLRANAGTLTIGPQITTLLTTASGSIDGLGASLGAHRAEAGVNSG